ncbi:MAG: hypothetical protein KIT14_12405 [bacterium]|nr:hypothetical protein [bacterium]
MRRAMRPMRRIIGALALVAVLLAIVGSVTHRHDDHGLVPVDCAACLAAHHAPAVLAPIVAIATPVERSIAVGDGPHHTPIVARVHRTGGRAPPRLPLV